MKSPWRAPRVDPDEELERLRREYATRSRRVGLIVFGGGLAVSALLFQFGMGPRPKGGEGGFLTVCAVAVAMVGAGKAISAHFTLRRPGVRRPPRPWSLLSHVTLAGGFFWCAGVYAMEDVWSFPGAFSLLFGVLWAIFAPQPAGAREEDRYL